MHPKAQKKRLSLLMGPSRVACREEFFDSGSEEFAVAPISMIPLLTVLTEGGRLIWLEELATG